MSLIIDNKRAFIGIISTAALALIVCRQAQAQAPKLVYLVNQIEITGEPNVNGASLITNQICTDLQKSLKNDTIHCPDDVKALMQAKSDMMTLGADGGNPALLMQQAAVMLNADRGISGSLAKMGSVYILQLKLMDYKSGKVLSRSSVQSSSSDMSSILPKIPEALTAIFKELKAEK